MGAAHAARHKPGRHQSDKKNKAQHQAIRRSPPEHGSRWSREARARSGVEPRKARLPAAMTKAQQREAAQVLKRVVERIDQGEVAAPWWLRERLVGAVLALDPEALIRR